MLLFLPLSMYSPGNHLFQFSDQKLYKTTKFYKPRIALSLNFIGESGNQGKIFQHRPLLEISVSSNNIFLFLTLESLPEIISFPGGTKYIFFNYDLNYI